MYKNKLLIVFLLFSVMARHPLEAASTGKGETVFPILKINSSVKSSAVAGSNASVMNGVQSAFLNPAGLAAAEKPGVYTNYTKWFQEINIGYMAVAVPFGENILGAGIGYLDYPELTAVTADPSGDYGYAVEDKFSASSGLLGVYYARKLSDVVSLGGGMKYVNEKIGDYSSAGTVAADTGLILSPSYSESYGVSMSNLSWGAKFESKTEPLPATLRVGGMWRYEEEWGSLRGWEYSLSLGTEIRLKDGIYLQGGTGISPVDFLTFCLGYNYALENDRLGKFSGGSCGILFGNPFARESSFSLEYALYSFGDLGLTHRIGVNF